MNKGQETAGDVLLVDVAIELAFVVINGIDWFYDIHNYYLFAVWLLV